MDKLKLFRVKKREKGLTVSFGRKKRSGVAIGEETSGAVQIFFEL